MQGSWFSSKSKHSLRQWTHLITFPFCILLCYWLNTTTSKHNQVQVNLIACGWLQKLQSKCFWSWNIVSSAWQSTGIGFLFAFQFSIYMVNLGPILIYSMNNGNILYMYMFIFCCGYWPGMLNISKLVEFIYVWRHFKQTESKRNIK